MPELSACGSNVPDMTNLMSEAAQMLDAVRLARGVGQVWTPEHLVPLRTNVRQHHAAQLRAVHGALDQGFKEPNADWWAYFAPQPKWRSWRRWVGGSWHQMIVICFANCGLRYFGRLRRVIKGRAARPAELTKGT